MKTSALRVLLGFVLLGGHGIGIAQPFPVDPPPPLWDAFVRMPWRLEVDGSVLACRDPGAHIVQGQCYVTSWIREPKGPAKRQAVQPLLEQILKGRIPPTKKPVLVAVGPEHVRDGNAADSFIAYYRLVDVAQ